jgi:hypothetical protein
LCGIRSKSWQCYVLSVGFYFAEYVPILGGFHSFSISITPVSCINGPDLFVQKVTNVNVCIVLLFFVSISSSKTKRFI